MVANYPQPTAVAPEGACFENACQIVLSGRILKPGEGPLAAHVEDLLQPGPLGVLQAKAAGIQASVTRDHAEFIA
jgi:hypothetical protein